MTFCHKVTFVCSADWSENRHACSYIVEKIQEPIGQSNWRFFHLYLLLITSSCAAITFHIIDLKIKSGPRKLLEFWNLEIAVAVSKFFLAMWEMSKLNIVFMKVLLKQGYFIILKIKHQVTEKMFFYSWSDTSCRKFNNNFLK